MGLSQVPDAELLRRHVEGDDGAFTVLVERHRDRLWAVALRTVGDREDAADALQDALVKAFRSASGFRGEAAVTTWLHRIVVNACLDRIRRRTARPTVPLPDEPDRVDALADAPRPDPAVQQERRMDVLAALQRLPVEQRTAVVLVDMEGYTVEEAAQVLGCAPGTVKSRCSRGRRRLAPLLSAWNPADAPAVRPDDGGPTEPEGGAPDDR